jgi:hypothetical protein
MRALVRAQLLEEGYSVRALPSLEMAVAYLLRSEERPRLAIIEAEGIQAEARQVTELWLLTGQAPLILCVGALGRELLEEDLPPARLLQRPFRVGDVVKEVRRVLECSESKPAAK